MDIGINFRSTSGYVSDGAGETYDLGAAYPVTRGGATFGWNSDLTSQSRDRSTGVDRRLAGLVFSGLASDYWRLDIPAAGQYDIYLGMGDPSNLQIQKWALKDQTTTLTTIDTTSATGHVADATGADFTDAAWPAGQSQITKTFATTELRFQHTSSVSGNATIQHIRVVSAGNRRRRVLICGGN